MILDTSVLVEIDRGHASDVKLEKLRSNYMLAVSSVTVSEFMAGAYLYGATKDELEDILGRFEEVGMQGEVARTAAELWAREISDDIDLAINDLYIAATALSRDEKLMTTDVKDFEEIDELEIEDWNEF